MELAAGARHRPAVLLLSAGCLPGRDRRRASGGIGWACRATAAGPRLTLLRPHVSRRVAASAASGGRFLPRHVARSGGGEPRGEDDACSDRSFPTRADPLDDAKDHAAAARLATDHPRGIRKELVNLAMPAIIGQAIDALAQLLETAYIGRLGPVQLASAAVGVSVFNIVSKLFNIPLLSITTSFIAEDVSTHDSSQFTSGGNISSEAGERKRLTSISSALLLAAAIGVLEHSSTLWVSHMHQLCAMLQGYFFL